MLNKGYLYCITALAVWLNAGISEAKLNVLTTITDLRSIAAEVGGDDIDVDAICKGTQDPHYIEAKPSFMVLANRADLIIAIGMDLEDAWLRGIVQGARNPKLDKSKGGYLEVGTNVDPLEVPQGKISRSDGDVHPFGNPHVTLDPIRAGMIATKIAEKLSELDPDHAKKYSERAKKLNDRLADKTKSWQTRIEKSGVKKIVTYHKTLTYFLDRFHIANPAILEPKPGSPPTIEHILEVIKTVKTEKVPLILVENFFDDAAANRVVKESPGTRAKSIPVAVDGAPGIKDLDTLYENIVQVIEGKK